MAKNLSIILLAFLILIFSAVLSGCGSSNPNTPFPFPAGTGGGGGGGGGTNFGSVTITGSTSATIIPSVRSGIVVAVASSTLYQWNQTFITTTTSVSGYFDTTSNTLWSEGITLTYNNAGVITMESYSAGFTNAFGAHPNLPGVTVNTVTRVITFTNVILQGVTVTGASGSVTVNGTLTY